MLAKFLVTTNVWLPGILTMQIYEYSAGKEFMQWELVLEYALLASYEMF